MFLHARDEAHRSANHLRLQVGKRKRLRSDLEGIVGVGPKTRVALLKALGSVAGVRAADMQALVQAGATQRQAQHLFAHFHGSPEEAEASEDVAVDNAFSDGAS